MQTRLTSSHFVGRIAELTELELAVREATAGRPALVLLGGESGVGKTRLVGELERRLSAGDVDGDGGAVLVLRGEAVEQGDGELPYAPLLSALRPIVRGRHAALDNLAPGSRRQLAALVPALDDGGPRGDPDDAGGQLRLFEALLELLHLLSESSPVALILEDMHWADRSTRTFVAFLARSLRHERLAILLTYRSDELHRRHALRPLLAELERLEGARRIELDPFDRDELAEALTDILGASPGPELVARLFTRSEGNPLYTEELLAAGLDGRGSAPQSLRDAFMSRIERLSEDAQRAARAVAVGRTLDQPTLAAVTQMEHASLQAALREAVSEQVLVAGDDDRFCFRHALLREALYDDLLPGERGELHLALARGLELPAGVPDEREMERATTIASHYAAAGDQPAALRANIRAARAAEQIHAYGEVADLAERALELWPRVAEDQRPTDLDHVNLLALAARAHGTAGDRTRGEVLLQSALTELDPDQDPRRYSGLLARLARTQWALNRGPQALETAQRALAMLPEGDGGRERARLLGWLARTRALRGRMRDAQQDGELALAAARAAHDSYAESEVLNTLGMAHSRLGDLERGLAQLRRAAAIARSNDDLDGESYAYANLADMLNLAGHTADALKVAQEGLDAMPRRLGRGRDWMMLTVCDRSFEAGDWVRARSHLDPVTAHVVGVLLIFRELCEAGLALGEGSVEVAAQALDRIEPLVAVSTEAQWHGGFGSLLADLRCRQGDLRGARAAVAQALDQLELCTDDVARIARVTEVGIRVEADMAQRARDLREPAQAREALTRARIHLQRLRAAAQSGQAVERAFLAVGKAEMARARGRQDPGLWAKAAAEWDAIQRPYPAAVARWRQAVAHVEADDRGAATEAADAAGEAARRLGSRWLADEVNGLCERARLRGAPGGDPVPAPRPASEDPFGLTPRERQVLELLAQGATNRQIGAALFMAEKTASVHVSRILAKLGVHTRTQAAAMAHRLDLARA
jgi:DNA-binding CsgD family transcriptional regulator/tetratricopeptide (TPR) repeat protein